MDSITPTNKTVKSKADYIALAESEIMKSTCDRASHVFGSSEECLKRASIYAQLAIAAPEASAPDDYLSVCRERDEMKRQRDELLAACKRAVGFFAIGGPLDFEDAEAECEIVEVLCRTAIQNAEQTAEPENAG